MLSDTELRLSFWRDGSTKAERLAAAVLRLSGYEEIDPQSPLGGPDGKKDIVCVKGGLSWVGAVYFPTGPVSFPSIRKKFSSDINGAPSHHSGFVFVTNQTLSPTQRRSLAAISTGLRREVDLLHLQQIQTLLDSPTGYGARIQYLGIGMSIEEQLSWSADSDSQTAKALAANTRELLALRSSVDRISVDQNQIMRTLAVSLPASAPTPDLISAASFAKGDGFTAISKSLSPELILLVHRLTCFDLPARAIGRLRTEQVWIGSIDGRRATHADPPPAVEVERRLTLLCEQWRVDVRQLRTEDQRIRRVAQFHAEFLMLHPFIDGNGRTARAILMQQFLDLFGRADMSLMNKGADYYAALEAADVGNYDALAAVLKPVVSS